MTWKNESERHALASKGVKTTVKGKERDFNNLNVSIIKESVQHMSTLRGLSAEINHYATQQKTKDRNYEKEMEKTIWDMKRYIKFYENNNIITSDDREEMVKKIDNITFALRYNIDEIEKSIHNFNHYLDTVFSEKVTKHILSFDNKEPQK